MENYLKEKVIEQLTQPKKDGKWCPLRVIPGPTGRMTKGDKIRARRERQRLAKEKAEAKAAKGN